MRRTWPAAAFALLLTALLAAGCADDGPDAATDGAPPAPETEPCTRADKDNHGVSVNGRYYADDGVWEETNGVTNLQKVATCEGPPDTRIA